MLCPRGLRWVCRSAKTNGNGVEAGLFVDIGEAARVQEGIRISRNGIGEGFSEG